MNDAHLPGPCADYEHDLVELNDGALPPERARSVRLHVEQCARCRAWQAEFVALDARLAAGLPRVQPGADFDAKLQARLDALARPAVRGDLRATVEREHDSLLDALRHGARRRALFGAVGSVMAAACVLVAARGLLAAGIGQLLPALEGPDRLLALGAFGAAVALAALAWSVPRGGAPFVDAWR